MISRTGGIWPNHVESLIRSAGDFGKPSTLYYHQVGGTKHKNLAYYDLRTRHLAVYPCLRNSALYPLTPGRAGGFHQFHPNKYMGEALSSPLPGKRMKASGVSATHCTQREADCVCNTLVPETGPPFWKPFFLPAMLRPRFFWTTKEQTGAARRSWRPGFRPFAGASLSSAMQAAMDTHVRIILWGDMAQKLLWISEKGPLSGAARSHANLLRSGSMPPLQRVRKLFCVHPGRSLWRAIVAVHPVRALWNIILYTAKAKALKGT